MLHCYKLCGYNIVLDVASGSIHSVDDVSFDIIRIYDEAQTGGAEVIRPPLNQISSQIQRIRPGITDEDIRAIVFDINKLIDDGKLLSQETYEHLAGNNADKTRETPLKALCLNVSHACNMTCAYCFAGKAAAEGGLMPFDTGKQAIDFLVRNSGGIKTLDVDFFGGEPLINWQVIKEIVAYARMAEKFTGKKFRFTLTTNGLLIDDDVIDFTNKQFHTVVLSLDGRRQVHDAMRKLTADAGNTEKYSGSYDEVLPKIKKLVDARRGKGYYIRGTYTRENLDFSNDIFHIADLGFSQISLEPVVTKPDDAQSVKDLRLTKDDLPELFRQYDLLAVEMRKRKDKLAYVRPEDVPKGYAFSFYHYNLDLENGPCVHKRIAGCGVAAQYLAVTPQGELYPCHQFIGNDNFIMGDVWRGIVNHNLRPQFAAANIYSRRQCKTCWARFYCSGGCAANAYHDTGNITGVYEVGCELFKKRLENAIMLQL